MSSAPPVALLIEAQRLRSRETLQTGAVLRVILCRSAVSVAAVFLHTGRVALKTKVCDLSSVKKNAGRSSSGWERSSSERRTVVCNNVRLHPFYTSKGVKKFTSVEYGTRLNLPDRADTLNIQMFLPYLGQT